MIAVPNRVHERCTYSFATYTLAPTSETVGSNTQTLLDAVANGQANVGDKVSIIVKNTVTNGIGLFTAEVVEILTSFGYHILNADYPSDLELEDETSYEVQVTLSRYGLMELSPVIRSNRLFYT